MPSRTLRRARARRLLGIRSGVATAIAGAGLLTAAAPAVAQVLLTQGSSGSAVTRVQSALHIRRTGHFDHGTRRAVVSFQHRDGLLVDGIVGPQTWDALFGITPPPSSETATADAVGSSGYSIPSSIVQCESGGDYGAVNPSSGAGGAYQILPSTWRAYGGQGLPQDAPPAEQDRIAAEIYAQQGGSAWTC